MASLLLLAETCLGKPDMPPLKESGIPKCRDAITKLREWMGAGVLHGLQIRRRVLILFAVSSILTRSRYKRRIALSSSALFYLDYPVCLREVRCDHVYKIQPRSPASTFDRYLRFSNR